MLLVGLKAMQFGMNACSGERMHGSSESWYVPKIQIWKLCLELVFCAFKLASQHVRHASNRDRAVFYNGIACDARDASESHDRK